MYGAQHEFILDDRDVDEYNKNPKFEQFAHLGQSIQKLIVYSTVKTVLNIDRARLWKTPPSWTPVEPNVFGYEGAVAKGMNIICLCHTHGTLMNGRSRINVSQWNLSRLRFLDLPLYIF